MTNFSVGRRLVAEGLGTALLLAVVIGSGIMGERLAGGNVAIALLGNTLATGAALVVLISVFGPISGAHLNLAVTGALLLRRAIKPRLNLAYVALEAVTARPVSRARVASGTTIWWHSELDENRRQLKNLISRALGGNPPSSES